MPHLSPEHLFGIKVGMGLCFGGWLIYWSAQQSPQTNFRRWLDTYLLIILGGIIGARGLYVLLNWGHFHANLTLIPRLWYGELAWQGALIGGGLMLWLLSRRFVWHNFLDGLALALPIGVMSVWWGCRSGGCGVGQSVENIHDYPVWLVGYLSDINGWVEPRYELQMLAVGLFLLIFLLIYWLTINQLYRGQRLGIVLILSGLTFIPLHLLRADAVYPALDLLGSLGLFIAGGVLLRWSASRVKSVAQEPTSSRL